MWFFVGSSIFSIFGSCFCEQELNKKIKAKVNIVALLIEENLIPDDVTVQVLTQAREHLIRKTFEALKGLDKAIVHVYNSTSILQRDVVFNKDKDEIKQIAIDGVQLVKDLSKELGYVDKKKYIKNPEAYKGITTQFYKGLRLLLTHQEHGIAMDDIISVLGHDEVIRRLKLEL